MSESVEHLPSEERGRFCLSLLLLLLQLVDMSSGDRDSTITLLRNGPYQPKSDEEIKAQMRSFHDFLTGQTQELSIQGVIVVGSLSDIQVGWGESRLPAQVHKVVSGASTMPAPTISAVESQTEDQPTTTHLEDIQNDGVRNEAITRPHEHDDDEEDAPSQGNDSRSWSNEQANTHVHESDVEAEYCQICGEELDGGHIAVFLNCGHTFCRDCLNQCFSVGLSNKQSFPPRCCSVEGIDINSVLGFLDEAIFERYTLVEEEYGTRNPTYCANYNCSHLFSPTRLSKSAGKYILCYECNQETCTECKQGRSQHTTLQGNKDICPEIISKEDKELADQKKWKQCPGCRILVEKNDGCDHMSCECGTEFCYRCGTEYATDHSCACFTAPDEDGWHHRVDDDQWDANDEFNEHDGNAANENRLHWEAFEIRRPRDLVGQEEPVSIASHGREHMYYDGWGSPTNIDELEQLRDRTPGPAEGLAGISARQGPDQGMAASRELPDRSAEREESQRDVRRRRRRDIFYGGVSEEDSDEGPFEASFGRPAFF